MLSCIAMSNISASAAVTSADEVNAGFVLTYDAENSDETTRYIKVDAVGASEDLQAVTLFVVFTGADFGEDSTVQVEMSDLPLADINAPTLNKCTYTASKGGWQHKLTWNSGADPEACYSDTYIGTFKITLPSNSTFDAEVVKVKLGNTSDKTAVVGTTTSDPIKADCHKITVPAYTTGGGEELPAFESITAEYLDRYDTDKTTVPVDAWTATIDWSSYKEVKALNWTLSVNGEEKSVAAATQTEITGEMTVLYGLAIAGQAKAELDTIDKDNVVLK